MFSIALTNVVMTLVYIFPGFVLGKMKKTLPEHLPGLSGLLLYVCSPCMHVTAYISIECTRENLIGMGLFFMGSLFFQAAFMGLIFLIFKRRFEDSRFRVMTIGSVLGNVGYFGLPIVRSLFPANPEVAVYSCMNILSMNIIVFTIGVYCLTRKKKYLSLKSAILNPTGFGFAVGFPLFLLGASGWLPPLLQSAVKLVGDMSTPLCMMILGVRLTVVSWKKLFTRPVVWLTCLGKLLVFPLFVFVLTFFFPYLGIDPSFRGSLVILAGAPCAAVILTLAELHKSETELAANSILLSTIFCFATIPLVALLPF